MYFSMKNYLKSNRNHTAKHFLISELQSEKGEDEELRIFLKEIQATCSSCK